MSTAAGHRPPQALLSQEHLFRLGEALLRDIPDAVVYADRDGSIRYWNPGAVRIFGYSEGEALGQSLDIIIPDRLRQRHWEGYRRMMETRRSQHRPDRLLSVPARTKSGESISIQFTVAPVGDEDGTLRGIVALLRDVTDTFQELKRLRAATRSP